jgi:hypothetical protein
MAEGDSDQGASTPRAEAGIIATEVACRLLMLSRQRLDQLAKDGWIARHAPGHWRLIDLVQGYIDTFDSCAMKVAAPAFMPPWLRQEAPNEPAPSGHRWPLNCALVRASEIPAASALSWMNCRRGSTRSPIRQIDRIAHQINADGAGIARMGLSMENLELASLPKAAAVPLKDGSSGLAIVLPLRSQTARSELGLVRTDIRSAIYSPARHVHANSIPPNDLVNLNHS